MNFDQICRLCCVEKSPLRQILENSQHSPLADIFSNVLQIVVSFYSGVWKRKKKNSCRFQKV